MGFNSENASKICFDIETAPLPDAADYLEPAEAPSNYKDPAKIAAAVAEKNAEALSKCALDVDLCRIVALGAWKEGGEPWAVVNTDEAEMLRAWWAIAADYHLVGFNCLAFDLPVLMRRSLYLGVPVPLIQLDRFKHPQVTDLMQVLSYNGTLKYRGLSFYARRFRIDVPDTMKGSDIGQAVTEGRWTDIEAHVLADARKTAMLAERLGLFRCAA